MILKAKRLDVVEPSPTLAITAKANALKAKGIDVVGFGAGEPDFDTPDFIKEAAKKAIQSGKTKYTPVSGIPSLKEAIIQKFATDNALQYSPKEIIVGTGGKQVLYNFFMATLNPGDEVIIPAPYWVSYADIVRLAEGVPVLLKTSIANGFILQKEQLKDAITKKTKVFIFNSPSNPTGAIYTKKDLLGLLEVLEKHEVLILSDDIYEKLLFDGEKFINPAMVSSFWKERTFVINGVSKAYSMTGWRIGYGAGNEEIVKNMDTIQGQSTSNASSISQHAAEAALRGTGAEVETMRVAFEKRRNFILELMKKIPEVDCPKPGGAFYVFPYLSKLYALPKFQEAFRKSGDSSKSKFFSDIVLDQYNVALVPGVAFGDDEAVRLSYALSESDIQKGVERIEACIKSFR